MWTVYNLAAKQERLGVVEAADEATAIEKAAAEFNGACREADVDKRGVSKTPRECVTIDLRSN